jgi:hypothetical protein
MKIPAVSLVLVLLLGSCASDLSDKSWEVDVLTPIAHTSLEISDITGDSLIDVSSDSLLLLVRSQKVYEFTLDDLVDPFSTTFENTAKLQTLDLGTRKIDYAISLGQLAAQQGPPFGNIIVANHGNNLPFPAISIGSPINYSINANQFFQSITLLDGWLIFELRNELPIDLINFEYDLINQQSQTLVTSGIIPLIPANGVAKDSTQLNNMTLLEGTLTAELKNLESPGSGGVAVPIDTSDQLNIQVTVKDLNPFEATAIFPAQDLIDYTEEVLFETDFELSRIVVDTGVLYMQAISTVEEPVILEYEIPSATKANQNLLLAGTLPSSPPNGTSLYNDSKNIRGYSVNLNGINFDPNVKNTFFAQLRARIDSSGNMVFISLEDSIYLTTGIQGLMPGKIEGWLGRDTISTDDEQLPLFLFEDIDGGSFDLAAARIRMELINHFGADMQFVLTDVRTENQASGQMANMNWTGLGQALNLPSALDDAPNFQPVAHSESWQLDESNSNLNELFNIQPDRLIYDLDLFINPSGIANPSGFAYRHHPIEAWMHVEIPLMLSLDGLLLIDTSDFKYSDIDPNDRLIGGILRLFADNFMPIEAEVDLIAIDSTGTPLDTLLGTEKIQAALLNANERVESSVRTIIEYPLDGQAIEQLKKADRMVFKGRYSTQDRPKRIPLYEHYRTELKLSGAFQFRIH